MPSTTANVFPPETCWSFDSVAGICRVPAAVPSVTQSNRSAPLRATKKILLPAVVSTAGKLWALPGARSRTSVVPASVPSVFQSSTPVAGVPAANSADPPSTAGGCEDAESSVPGARSRNILVPAAVPSLIHGSQPCTTSLALNSTRSPTAVMENATESRGPPSMSTTMCVPASVPSLTHSSLPEVPLFARKKMREPATVSARLHAESFTLTVPSAVPSVFQSALPAMKYTRSFMITNACGSEPWKPGVMSFTSRVPAGVASVIQSSRPFDRSEAEKSNFPRKRMRSPGLEVEELWLMSASSWVPAAVPSDIHNSSPRESVALKTNVPFTTAK